MKTYAGTPTHKESIMNYIRNDGWGHSSAHDISKHTGISKEVVNQCLCKLHRAGELERERMGKIAIYGLKKNF